MYFFTIEPYRSSKLHYLPPIQFNMTSSLWSQLWTPIPEWGHNKRLLLLNEEDEHLRFSSHVGTEEGTLVNL